MSKAISFFAAISERNQTKKMLPFMLSFLYLLIKAVNNLLYLSVLTIFLEKAGANTLPWVYLAVNVGFILIQFQFITRIVGFEGHWLLSKISIPMMLFSFVAAMVLPTESTIVLIAFLVAAMLSDLTSNQAFTAMLNHFLTMNEAKKTLPFVYASGSLGYILSGLLLKFVLDLAGFQGLLFMNGIIAIICRVIISMLKPVENERLANASDEDDDSDSERKENVESSLKHPLARLLIFSSFLIIFNRYLIDFLFAAAVTAYFSSGKSLASFMGIFGAAADLIVIGLQTFVMKAVFSSISVGRVLTFVPAILTFLCLSASFSKEFAIIATVQFLVLINSKNFTVPATTMLMGAIPQKNRVFYRRDMSVACSVASTLVGIFLLLVRNNLSPATLFLIAAALYLLLAIIHFMLDKAYLLTLRRYVMASSGRADEEQVTSLRYLQQKDRLEQLKLLLKSEDSDTRLLAIKEAAELPPATAESVFNWYLGHENDSRCIAQAARSMLKACGNKAFSLIHELINNTEEKRLKADLIEALGQLRGSKEVEEIFLEYLSHEHHRVKASAIIGMLRTTRDRSNLQAALTELSEMVRDGAELFRASAAAVMGEVGLPLFIPCLESIGFAKEPAVAISAVNAISRIQTPSALASLDRLKQHENAEVASAAEKLSSVAAKSSFEQIGRLLTTISAEERLQLAARLKKMRNDDSHELLAMVLCVDNLDARKRLIQLLEKADTETGDLISRCLVSKFDNSVSLSIAPAFSRAIDEFILELPAWAEVINAIGAGALENPSLNKNVHSSGLHFLAAIWAENIEFFQLKDYSGYLDIMKQRNLVACQLFFCLSKDPVSLLKSLDRACHGSSYARSMALEYIETKVNRNVADLVVFLISDFDGEDRRPESMLAKAGSLGLEISKVGLGSARARIEQHILSEKNEDDS